MGTLRFSGIIILFVKNAFYLDLNLAKKAQINDSKFIFEYISQLSFA
jgi:hypothetical protein